MHAQKHNTIRIKHKKE